MIEKMNTDATPVVKTFIEVTPEMLETAARKLKLAKELAAPNQEIQLDFSQSVTLRWNPEVSTSAFNKRSLKPQDVASDAGSPSGSDISVQTEH